MKPIYLHRRVITPHGDRIQRRPAEVEARDGWMVYFQEVNSVEEPGFKDPYIPHLFENLPFELARVADGDIPSAKRFAARFGALRANWSYLLQDGERFSRPTFLNFPLGAVRDVAGDEGRTSPHLLAPDDVFRQQVADEAARKNLWPYEFDSLTAMWGQAHSVRSALQLHKAMTRNEKPELSEMVQGLLSRYWYQPNLENPFVDMRSGAAFSEVMRLGGEDKEALTFEPWRAMHFMVGGTPNTTGGLLDEDADMFGVAGLLVEDIVNGNLARVRTRLLQRSGPVTSDTHFDLEFTSRTLIEEIWILVAELISNPRRSNLRSCLECGNLFNQTDRRQRYCPPSDYERRQVADGRMKRAQSACRQRHAYKRRKRAGETSQ